MKEKIEDVTAYIAAAPTEARSMLREMRKLIKACAPGATEKLSYGMPYYGYHGRLVYFAAHKEHVGLYAMGQSMKAYAKEVEPYRTSKATLRFPYGSKLPVALLRKMIVARMKENEASRKPKGRS